MPLLRQVPPLLREGSQFAFQGMQVTIAGLYRFQKSLPVVGGMVSSVIWLHSVSPFYSVFPQSAIWGHASCPVSTTTSEWSRSTMSQAPWAGAWPFDTNQPAGRYSRVVPHAPGPAPDRANRSSSKVSVTTRRRNSIKAMSCDDMSWPAGSRSTVSIPTKWCSWQ